MKKEWKCKDCVKYGTDACFNGGRFDYDECKYKLIDCDYAYEQGRSDKYQEIISEYMLLTEKQVAEIRADAIDECIKILLDMSCVKDCYKQDCADCMTRQIEQLKEQSNENN